MGVAQTILQQLGGNKFLAMTGAKDLIADGNTLRMTLRKNKSKANRLWITYNKGKDSYTMKFFNYTPMRVSARTGIVTDENNEIIKEYGDVYFDQLQELFTSVTGMHTSL